jgi:hypothetical protein
LFIDQNVSRLDGTVFDAEVVQVGERRSQGGTEAGDHL